MVPPPIAPGVIVTAVFCPTWVPSSYSRAVPPASV
ncbi:Uncharacterised protein [Mycobacteroides abscessus]|nr:Uncharacterised protein [Mycobacteroides abscessus]